MTESDVRASTTVAIAAVVLVSALPARPAQPDALDDFLGTLSTLGVVDPAVVEAKPMIQCLIGGKSVDHCAEEAAGQAHGLVPNDPKIKKVIDIFHALNASPPRWLDVFMLAGEQVVCAFVPAGGAVKDLFCTEIFDVAEPVITAAYEAVTSGDIFALVSTVGVGYACDLLPDAPGASELCGVLGDVVQGIADGITTAVAAVGGLAEDLAGQSQHMSVEQYYLKYWRPWLHYAVVKNLKTGQPHYLYAGNYASSSTSCAEYFDSHKMSKSNANKVCGIMKKEFLTEVDEVTKVWQAYPAAFFKGWAVPQVPGWAVQYYPVAGAYDGPFKIMNPKCHEQVPLAMSGMPHTVHPADVVNMGTAAGWACLEAGRLLAEALFAEKGKIDSLEPKVTALGCKKPVAPTGGPGIHFTCETYEAFQACEALYAGGKSQQQSLCWINYYSAEPALAKAVVDELGAKRCRTVDKPYPSGLQYLLDVQCNRPWKRTACESLVAALSEGAHRPSDVACLLKGDRMFIAGKTKAAAIVKDLNVASAGMGSVDPQTGVSSGLAVSTQANCTRAADDEWDPLRIRCEADAANQELAAALPTCGPDPGKEGADAPCYDGPLTLAAPVDAPAVAKPAVPFPETDLSRIIDVDIDFFDRNGTEWVPADQPSVGGMVTVRCVYEHAPVRARNPDVAWSIGFLEGGRLIEEAVGPGPVDSAGRVTRTWYGKLLAAGPLELGCSRAVGGQPDTGSRILRTVDVPAAGRTAREQRGPRIVAVTPLEAASARGTPPAVDLRFAHFAGIKRTTGITRFRESPVITTAAVGEPLAVDCSYVASMDAPNGEHVMMGEWQAVIEQEGRPARNVPGNPSMVSMRGVSTPGTVVHRFTPDEAGKLRFHCRLDTGGAIAETDETNNELELELTVTRLRRSP